MPDCSVLTIDRQVFRDLVLPDAGTEAYAVPARHSDAATEIGRRIRATRQDRQLSLEDLGALAEIAWTNIGKIERGVVSPTVETVVRIATALEADPADFVRGLTADLYPDRAHRYTARDLIAERDRRTPR